MRHRCNVTRDLPRNLPRNLRTDPGKRVCETASLGRGVRRKIYELGHTLVLTRGYRRITFGRIAIGDDMACSGIVLVVDDDVEIRETVSALLQHEGYTVIRAEN